MSVETLADGGTRHWPSASVWQIATPLGTAAAPVSAASSTVPEIPTLDTATAKAPVPPIPGTSTMPLLPAVATSATTSGVGPDAPDSRNVLTPLIAGTGSVFVPAKLN